MPARTHGSCCRLSTTLVASLATIVALNCGSGTEPSTPVADIGVSVIGPEPDSVALGDDVTFLVRVQNGGPVTAERVAVQASLVGMLNLVSISDGGTLSGNTITWPIQVSLEKDKSLTFTVVVYPTAEGRVSVTAKGSTSTEDPDPTNNDGSADDATAAANATI